MNKTLSSQAALITGLLLNPSAEAVSFTAPSHVIASGTMTIPSNTPSPTGSLCTQSGATWTCEAPNRGATVPFTVHMPESEASAAQGVFDSNNAPYPVSLITDRDIGSVVPSSFQGMMAQAGGNAVAGKSNIVLTAPNAQGRPGFAIAVFPQPVTNGAFSKTVVATLLNTRGWGWDHVAQQPAVRRWLKLNPKFTPFHGVWNEGYARNRTLKGPNSTIVTMDAGQARLIEPYVSSLAAGNLRLTVDASGGHRPFHDEPQPADKNSAAAFDAAFASAANAVFTHKVKSIVITMSDGSNALPPLQLQCWAAKGIKQPQPPSARYNNPGDRWFLQCGLK